MTSQSSSTSPAFEDFSQKIYFLRLFLILSIILIHARFMSPDYPDNWCKWLEQNILVGKVPHCAVTAFFVISGYLFTWTDNSNYFEFLKKKCRSLLIPYILWNTILMIFHLLRGMVANFALLPSFKYAEMTPWQIFVRSYGLDMRVPIDVPLWYVRNLLFFFPLAPLLLWGIRRIPIWLTPIILIITSFFLTDNSIIFFCFGMFCRHCDLDLRPLNKWWPFAMGIPLAYFILAEFHWMNWQTLQWISLPFYASCATLMQHLPQNLQKHIIHLGEYSFWIYCTHSPLATTLARAGRVMRFLGLSPVLYVFANCALTFIICVMALRILKRYMPTLASVLCGTRIPKSRAKNA